MRFCIKWCPAPGQGGYCTKRSPDRKPYAAKAQDPDVRQWASRQAAQRFLALKDSGFASCCVIEEVSRVEGQT